MTPVKDTVWWNTPGGKVTEHRDQAGTSCTLMLYNDAGSVFFEWTGASAIVATAINGNWRFPENSKMPVAMQMGDAWWSNGADSTIIQGEGHGNAVSFTLNKPIGDLLRAADHVLIRTRNADLSIGLNPTKMTVLLSRAQACRDVIKR